MRNLTGSLTFNALSSLFTTMDAEGIILRSRTSASVGVGRRVLRVIALVFLLALTFRVFLASMLNPIVYYLEFLLEVALVLYLLYRVVLRVVANDYSISPFHAYLGLLFIFPLFPSLAAWNTFDQPVFYGLATYRDFYLLFGGLVIYHLLRDKHIDLKDVEYSFVALAVLFMLFSYLMTIFVDPAKYVDTALSGANPEKGEGAYYRFNMSMFFFGAVYFTVRAFYRKQWALLIPAALFIYYVIFIRLDRTSMAFMLLGLLLFFLTATTLRSKVGFILASLLPAVIGVLLVYIFSPEIIERYTTMFVEVIDVAGKAGSGSIEDNVRLMEVETAINGIKKSPIFGNGKVSTFFVPEGYSHFYGFFYTSDVGILGYLFSSGIFGLLVIFAQFFFALYFVLRIRYIKRNVFLVALKFTLIIHLLDGITTEYLTMYAGQTLTMIILIHYFYQKDRVIAAELVEEERNRWNEPRPNLQLS
jgi:O-antigen ligase